MKKFSSILLVAILPLVNAQVAYTATDYASVDDNIEYLTANLQTTINFALTGNNHNWNFNALTTSSNMNVQFIDPAATSYKNLWCLFSGYISNCNNNFNNNFNLAQKLIELPSPMGTTVILDDVYMHSYKTNSEIANKMLGFKIISNNISMPMFIEYQQPDIIYKFPMNYGDSYTEPFSLSTDLTSQGIDFKLASVGTRANQVDGWGNLTVDNKTYNNVIRLKTISDQQITRTQSGNTEISNIKTVNYQWFSKDYKFPIMDVMGLENNGNFLIAEIRYIKSDAVLASNQVHLKKDIIYPNPSKGILKTNIPAGEIISINIYNQSGQLVGKSLDITNLATGNYVIKIKTLNKIYSQKVIKE